MSKVTGLSYLGIEASDLPAWRRFAAECLGMDVSGDDALAIRFDDHAARLFVTPGDLDDLAFAGFEVATDADLETIAGRATAAGISIEEGKPETVRARGVQRLLHLEDPSGLPIELCVGPTVTKACETPLVPSGFVTGKAGLGHIVVRSRDSEASNRFYCDLLGFKLTDVVRLEVTPDFVVNIRFLHVNPRHHTLAFAEAPLPKRIEHFMVEVGDEEDVGRAHDRCLEAGVPIARSLGRHANDRMFSFYSTSPSGFSVEFGADGLLVADETWQVKTYDQISLWGHRTPSA